MTKTMTTNRNNNVHLHVLIYRLYLPNMLILMLLMNYVYVQIMVGVTRIFRLIRRVLSLTLVLTLMIYELHFLVLFRIMPYHIRTIVISGRSRFLYSFPIRPFWGFFQTILPIGIHRRVIRLFHRLMRMVPRHANVFYQRLATRKERHGTFRSHRAYRFCTPSLVSSTIPHSHTRQSPPPTWEPRYTTPSTQYRESSTTTCLPTKTRETN